MKTELQRTAGNKRGSGAAQEVLLGLGTVPEQSPQQSRAGKLFLMSCQQKKMSSGLQGKNFPYSVSAQHPAQ